MSTSLFSKTPMVTVLDNRGLTVRNIAYHRHPDAPDVTREYIIRHRYDARGFLARSADPRLHDAGLANFSYLTDLAGRVLRTVSADSGTTVVLNDAAGRPCIAVSNIRTADDGTEERSRAITRTGRNPAGTSLEHYGAGYHEVAELVGRRTEAAREVFYSYGNLTGSYGLELDGDGKVITTEEYYP